MARAAEEQQTVSFDPGTFYSGRWDGGRGVVQAEPEPHFEYRSFKGNDGGSVTVIEANFTIRDQEGNDHETRWRGFYADSAIITESPENGADEAETGPSVRSRDESKKLKLRGDSELGQLFASLQTQGYPSTKLGKGDLRVFAGLDAEWVQYARKKDDKYPILVVGEIFEGKGGGKAAATAKSTASAPKPNKPVPVAATAEGDDDDEPAAAGSGDPEETTLALVIEALGDAEDPTGLGTTVGDVIRFANKKLKGDPALKKSVLDLLSDGKKFAASQDGIAFKAKTNSFVLVE